MTCHWRLVSVVGVALLFEIFELEANHDVLYVYEGLNGDSLIKVLTGSELPEPIVSASTGLLLRFATDRSIERRGFRVVLSTLADYTASVRSTPPTFVPSYRRAPTMDPARKAQCTYEQAFNDVTGVIDFYRVDLSYATCSRACTCAGTGGAQGWQRRAHLSVPAHL